MPRVNAKMLATQYDLPEIEQIEHLILIPTTGMVSEKCIIPGCYFPRNDSGIARVLIIRNIAHCTDGFAFGESNSAFSRIVLELE